MQNNARFIKSALPTLAWTLAFAVAYAQAPLYTSNQNQYFLHGLARAGWGTLSEDWLANTLDPAPVFSFMVEWAYRIFASELIFYFIYALLMGVYLFSVAGIVSTLYDLHSSKARRFGYFALLILVHSAALRFLFSRTLGFNWAYVLEAGVAGQRIMGSVLQPSAFGVLIALSIYLFLRGQRIWAAALLPLTATFHPTYLLSAAVLTAAYMVVAYQEERKLKPSFLIGLTALALVLPILAYSITVFTPTSAEVFARTRDLLVHYRIPHHATPAEWFDASAVAQLLIVGLALFLIRKTRLFLLLAIPAATALALTLLQIFTGSDALALIFPWRMSVFIVPLSACILVGHGWTWVGEKYEPQMTRYQRALNFITIFGILSVVSIGAVRFSIESANKSSAPERLMMAFVAQNAAPGQVYLTPIKMQDFRLVTGAPVLVDFKSIPYQDVEVEEWYTRVQLADQFYLADDEDEQCGLLSTLADEYGVTHAILRPEQFTLTCEGLREQYRDADYGVYALER